MGRKACVIIVILLGFVFQASTFAQKNILQDAHKPSKRQKIGAWYDCSDVWDDTWKPKNAFDSNGEIYPSLAKVLSMCEQRGHVWHLIEKEKGPVYGGPFVEDDSTCSVMVRVQIRDYKLFECKRCGSMRRIIKWKTKCKLLWRERI